MHNFHTGAMTLYIATIVILASVFTHPFYLLSLLLSVIAAAFFAGCMKEMKTYFKVALPMALLIMIINPLVSRAGKTIVFQGPKVLVLGKLKITLEALLYGGNMGIKLMVIIGAFCLFNLLIDPDKFLSFCSKFITKSAVAVSLTTRMVPGMAKRLREIKGVMRTRGVNLTRGGRVQQIKCTVLLVKVLLLSSLEDTFKVAESMQARAFGSTKRSCYAREKIKPRDVILIVAIIIAWMLAVIAFIEGWGRYDFYPTLAPLGWEEKAVFSYIAMTIVVMSPAILALGCKKWQFMSYKI